MPSSKVHIAEDVFSGKGTLRVETDKRGVNAERNDKNQSFALCYGSIAKIHMFGSLGYNIQHHLISINMSDHGFQRGMYINLISGETSLRCSLWVTLSIGFPSEVSQYANYILLWFFTDSNLAPIQNHE